MKDYSIVIIGGGPAGLSAAIGAYEAGARDIVILENDPAPGGILGQCIHNGFGLHLFGEELTGPEYAARLLDKVKAYQIDILCGTLVMEITEDRRVVAASSEHGVFELHPSAVILAMGCRERPRGAISIAGTRPAGVYTAGCAQKLANIMGCLPGREAVILGSGDIGLIMARRLTYLGAKVHAVVELMEYSSGLRRNIAQCLNDYDIPLLLSHTVTEVHGEGRVTGVTVCRVDPQTKQPIPGEEKYFACDTLLLSVGLIPQNTLSADAGVKLHPVTGGAVVDENYMTGVRGIFSCGNVLHVHDLVDNVTKESILAGEAAARFVRGEQADAPGIAVAAGEGATYVLPARVSGTKDVTLRFRVRREFRKGKFTVRCGEKEICTQRFAIAVPGEMQEMAVKAEALQACEGEITLCVSE